MTGRDSRDSDSLLSGKSASIGAEGAVVVGEGDGQGDGPDGVGKFGSGV